MKEKIIANALKLELITLIMIVIAEGTLVILIANSILELSIHSARIICVVSLLGLIVMDFFGAISHASTKTLNNNSLIHVVLSSADMLFKIGFFILFTFFVPLLKVLFVKEVGIAIFLTSIILIAIFSILLSKFIKKKLK